MTITNQQHRLAGEIDAWVKDVLGRGGGDEQLLEGMYDYMAPFKQILDTAGPADMDALCRQCPGFYRLAQLLESLAQRIADGVIPVPEETLRPRKQRPRELKPGKAAGKEETVSPSRTLSNFQQQLLLSDTAVASILPLSLWAIFSRRGATQGLLFGSPGHNSRNTQRFC